MTAAGRPKDRGALRVAEVAAWVGCSKPIVQRAIQRGECRAKKLTEHLLIVRIEDAQEWIDSLPDY